MFQELMPLLSQRVLIITLCRANEEEVRVNIIPKPLKSDQQDDDAALTTPLGVTGTPKELDEQLPSQLVEFVETHLGLSSTLNDAKEQMDAAAKAARETARKSTATKSHGSSGKSATLGFTQAQTEAETNDTVGGSQSNPELAETAPSGVAATADRDATGSGNLFDLATKTRSVGRAAPSDCPAVGRDAHKSRTLFRRVEIRYAGKEDRPSHVSILA